MRKTKVSSRSEIRERKKRKKMLVSGKSVLKLKKIIERAEAPRRAASLNDRLTT